MNSLLTKIYLYRIFSELMLLYPLYNVMFAERGGLSMYQISTLLSIWAIIILICEIPAGAIADKYTRRNVLGVAQIIRAVGYGLWIFMPTYWGFLLGLGLWGVARALTSGTFEALVYDELKAARKEKTYAKVLGRSESFATLFSLGSTLLATPVFAWSGYVGVLWFSVVATIISGIVAFTLPVKKKEQSVEQTSYLGIFHQAAVEIRHNPQLIKLIGFSVFVGVLFRIFDEYTSLIIKADGVMTTLIPIASMLVFLPVVLTDFFAYKLEHVRQIFFIILATLAGVALMLAGKLMGITGIGLYALFLLLVKGSMTIFNAKVQHSIRGEARATITSVSSFGVECAAVIGFFVYGVCTQFGGNSLALEIFGGGVMLVSALYLVATHGRLVHLRKMS